MSASTTHGRHEHAWRTPLKNLEDTARHLHEIELDGESPATPAISIAEVLLVVGPIFCVIAALSFLAYYVLA